MTDVEDLSNLELEAREGIARKVGHILASSDDETEQKAALDLAKILAEDVAVTVREALSSELKSCIFLPPDLLSIVAKDIEQVSNPFLVASEAMDDVLLEEIVRSCGDGHQEAVASRNGISEAVSFVIADVGCHSSVDQLSGNDTADMAERSFKRVIDRFPQDVGLMEKLASRSDLPVEVVEKLVFKISNQYGELLISKFGISRDYSSYLVSLVNRKVFSRTLEMSPQAEIENYLSQLHARQNLGSDVLLTYLQNNNLRLFTSSLAVIRNQPYDRIEQLVSRRDKKIVARLLDGIGFSKAVIGVLLISYERLAF